LHGDCFSNEFWKKEEWINKFLFNIGLKNLKIAGSIRTVSNRIKKDLIAQGIGEEKITNVPINVPWQSLANQVPGFSLKEKYPQFDYIALSLGRLEKVKNINLILQAWQKLLNDNPKVGLVIVGSGSEEANLRQIVNDLNIQDNVIFEPATKDVVSYYRGADCFVLSSYYEGWGRTVVEAIACDCPVIMTDVGCAGELVKDGESGVVIERNKESLAKALNYFIKSSKDDEMAENARKLLETLPNNEKTKELYLESWKKTIKK